MSELLINPISRGRDGEDQYDYKEAGTSLLHYSGKVFLCGSKSRDFVCMATWIGDGYFLTTWDTVQTKGGSFRYEGIEVETAWGGPYKIEWVVQLPHKPLLLMKCEWPSSAIPLYGTALISLAPLFDILETKGKDRFWRVGYTSGTFGEFVDPNGPALATPGYHVYDLAHQWYRGPHDALRDAQSTICLHCCFEYPARKDYGSPVVLQDGRLAAILVSGDLGPQSTHEGVIIPLELVQPTVRLWAQRSQERGFQSRHRAWVSPVAHF